MDDTFEVKSGKMVLSDPCYELGTWCQGVIDNVKNGTWIADVEYVNSWGRRVARLTAYHKDHYTYPKRIEISGKKMDFDGGVDSGQFLS